MQMQISADDLHVISGLLWDFLSQVTAQAQRCFQLHLSLMQKITLFYRSLIISNLLLAGKVHKIIPEHVFFHFGNTNTESLKANHEPQNRLKLS